MKQIITAVFLSLLGAFYTDLAFSEGDATKGKSYYAACTACHGLNGEGNQATNGPRLAGLNDWYLILQLKKYRAGIRGYSSEDSLGQQMAMMANTLPNDQAILDVVAYIGLLDPGQIEDTDIGGDIEKGKVIYLGCTECHGVNGQGLNASVEITPNAPRLSGQHGWYLVQQLKNFKSGIRGKHEDDSEGKIMRVQTLSLYKDEMLNDVITYINSLE